MIAVLRRGMRLRLPSGQVIVLIEPTAMGEWRCHYALAVKGEVHFRGAFLRRVCRVTE